jgi:glutaminase
VRPSVIRSCLEAVHAALRDLDDGEVAGYIPELAKADPARFGIAVATVDGHLYVTGDADAPFTIQSISKPFVYGMALDDRGPDEVLQRIGVEPSGDAFNSIVMDERRNRPLNPMVNAGAIACAALVRGADPATRRQRVLDAFGRYAGRRLDVDADVCESERRTGHRNRAIAWLELSSGMIDGPVDEHLDLYFEQCSILVTATDLAVMAATLANGGRNPLTGERALSAPNVSRVLTVMATCGMYDWSGEWMFRVGLPAKSGVGGGILAVLPGQLGIGTFSPRLDEHGNSVRGVRVCEELARTFSLHLLDATATATPVVRQRHDARQVPSKRWRRTAERAVLDERGGAIVVLELQGDLYFAPAEQLVRGVEDELATARHLVLDARRLGRVTASAAALLAELRREVVAAGARLVLAAPPAALVAALAAAGADWPDADVFADADRAVECGEDALLAAHGPGTGTGVRAEADGAGAAGSADESDGLALSEVDLLRELPTALLATVAERLETTAYAAGDVIVREGDLADRLCFLVAGTATVRVDLGDGTGRTRRLRTFGPGTCFGESALLDGGRRTASVTADGPAVVRTLSVADLDGLGACHPEIRERFLVAVGRNLSEMLQRAIGEIRALGG